MKKIYFMFIRISDEEFIDSLQKKGHIYCNSIKYFRSIEDNCNRGDKNEGKAFIKQVKNLEISLKGKVIGKAEKAQMYFEHEKNTGNIFCLYGVETSLMDKRKKSRQKILIEKEPRSLGKAALLVFQIEEFINRISNKLNTLGKEYKFSPVYYFDPNTYEGGLNPFCKSNKYKYQNEVRLWVQNAEDKPYEFYIGDISDISRKIPACDLDNIEIEVI